MSKHKFTDEEIIAGLEHCTASCLTEPCEGCPFDGFCSDDLYILEKEALGLIRHQKAEIEELVYKLECLLCHATGSKLSKHTYPLNTMYSAVNDEVQDYCEEAQAEVIKEFAERLKAKSRYPNGTIYVENIDNLVKEMTEGRQ